MSTPDSPAPLESGHAPAPTSAAALAAIDADIAGIASVTGLCDGCGPLLVRLAGHYGAARGSLLILHHGSGRLRFVAALGMAEEILGQDVPVRDRSIADWVYHNRRSLILNGQVRDRRFQGGPSGAGISSALCVPIQGRGGIVGVLNLARVESQPEFTPTELAEIERLMPTLADAIERLQHWELAARDRRTLAARAPLVSRVPRGASEARNVQFAYSHVPGQRRGGDCCDRAPQSGGGQLLMVADVPGDGAAATAISSLVQGLFIGLASTDRSPIEIASRIHAELQARFEGGTCVAIWLAHLSPNGQLQSCTAGYPPPLWIPADGGDPTRLDVGGSLLGASTSVRYEQESLRLLPGDTLLVASNGVWGSRDGKNATFGPELLLERVEEQQRLPLDRLTEAILQGALAHAGHPAPLDDLGVFGLRFHFD